MAALAYVLLPLSGLTAFFMASSPRVRLHGLQSVLIGALWPGALYAGSAITPGATQAVFVAGVLIWLVIMGAAALGIDLWLPGIGGPVARAAGLARPAKDGG